MAFFNPQPVTFNPSPVIMEGANAIGKTMQELYKQHYQEAQDKVKEQQAQRAYDLQNAQFDFHKGRAGVQDAQWQKSYDAGREDKLNDNEFRMAEGLRADMRHNDTVAYQNKSLGLQQQTLNNATNWLNDKKRQEEAKGMYIARALPEFAKSIGMAVDTPNSFEGDTMHTPKGSYAALGGLDDMYKTKMALDAKEADPYKAYMVQDRQERAEESKRKNLEIERLKAKELQQEKITSLQKQFNENPKSILGVNPQDLSNEDYQAFIADLNTGNVGTVAQEKGRFYGTNPRYVPFSQQTSTQQQGVSKSVVERRQTKDGRILVKYSDGTIGAE